jgi:hypothetical protein
MVRSTSVYTAPAVGAGVRLNIRWSLSWRASQPCAVMVNDDHKLLYKSEHLYYHVPCRGKAHRSRDILFSSPHKSPGDDSPQFPTHELHFVSRHIPGIENLTHQGIRSSFAPRLFLLKNPP